tara:strand:+ start:364 stop:885 length:522 start_codon:yes stop_codon:yes gene_type:complete
MRIVGGELSGRRIAAPRDETVRPTSDRAREAIFNMLYSLGLPKGCRVVDLFAGSGALGIEALSRGAEEAYFVDKSAESCRTIKDNLEGLAIYGRVIQGDALQKLGSLEVDLVLADPPYGFDDWNRLLTAAGKAVVVAESDSAIEALEGWEVVRSRKYGRAMVTILLPIKRDDG